MAANSLHPLSPTTMMYPTSVQQYDIPEASDRAGIRYFRLETVHELAAAIHDLSPSVLGVSVGLNNTGSITAVALATEHDIFHLCWEKGEAHLLKSQRILSAFKSLFLSAHDRRFAAFEMGYVAFLIYGSLDVHVQGVDLSTVTSEKLKSPGSVMAKLKNLEFASQLAVDVRWDWLGKGKDAQPDICVRAWYSAITAGAIDSLLALPLLKTDYMNQTDLRILHKWVKRIQLLNNMKPLIQENDFHNIKLTKNHEIIVQNARFKARVRRSEQTSVQFIASNGDVLQNGRATDAIGKRTTVKALGALNRTVEQSCKTVRVHGREEPTNAEFAQYWFLLDALRGKLQLRSSSSFIELLWFPKSGRKEELKMICLRQSHQHRSDLDKFNDSQWQVIEAMSSEEPLVIVHGPPGTGKTSTIAGAVKRSSNNKEPVWVVAQSNVGVKNIAEKFFKESIDFKLIVSKEFYFEWHEEMYEEIQHRIIRSDDLPRDDNSGVTIGDLLLGSTVVLCTLSMLSNPTLHNCRAFSVLPVERLVIDEASQIDAFEFMHIFHKFKEDLIKVSFFGDPKQLPPYGAEQAKLETIFDIKHLSKTAYFLDTQYRMPVPLGNFISKHVYGNRLRSKHNIRDAGCIQFIDVSKGEEQRSGSSSKNMEEVRTVVRLVKQYYNKTNFCVITPYDAQRSAISMQLKKEKDDLPFDRVFNVDSFQGNEADYVIVSAVRSKGPGFLRSENRMNVMLTRCKKGMVIVTSRAFLRGGGRKTLLGQLAAEYEDKFGVEKTWTDWRRVAEGKAGGPTVAGVSARRSQLTASVTNTAPSVPAGSHARNNALERRKRLRSKAVNAL